MGGHKYRCDPCDFECRVNNSCGDRHCPQCAGAKRADWLDSTSQLLLPGITYFQVVFTIPDKLSSLALGNREEMYDLLFRAAWKTRVQFDFTCKAGTFELGGEAAKKEHKWYSSGLAA